MKFPKPNKYGAKKIYDETGKIVADSKAERLFLTNYLALREKAGEISNIERWPTVYLTKYVKWKLDYSYTEDEKRIFTDVKGGATKGGRFPVLCQLWKTHGKGILEIAEYNYRSKLWHIKRTKPDVEPL